MFPITGGKSCHRKKFPVTGTNFSDVYTSLYCILICIGSVVIHYHSSLWPKNVDSNKWLQNFGLMYKLGLPYLPSTLVWTRISLDKYTYFVPNLPIQKVWTFFNSSLFLNIYFLTFVRILLLKNQVKYHQRPSSIEDFLRDYLKGETKKNSLNLRDNSFLISLATNKIDSWDIIHFN